MHWDDLIIAWESGFSLHKREVPVFRCMFCKKKIFTKPIFEQRLEMIDGALQYTGPWVLSGEAAFHFQDTHGYFPEDFLWMTETALSRIASDRARLPS